MLEQLGKKAQLLTLNKTCFRHFGVHANVFVDFFFYNWATWRQTKIPRHLYCEAPAAQRAANHSPILKWERKGNPSMYFLMVIMASGIARGCLRTTTTATTATESLKMETIIQIID